MQESRLFKIIYYLLDKGRATAPELADKLEVSVRTIYRDADRLSSAGIPIYISSGRNGGLQLLDGFVLDKSMLSEQEKQEILMSVQSLCAVQYSNAEDILTKLRALFHVNDQSWIELDFSRWGSTSDREKKLFQLIKNSILNRLQITFDYYSSNGANTHRSVEPAKLLYKDKAWYLSAFCLLSNDWRLFRITRMKNCCATDIHFEPNKKEKSDSLSFLEYKGSLIDIELLFSKEVEYRLYDILDDASINLEKEQIRVRLTLPDNEWVTDFIMSFGDKVTVLHPLSLKNKIIQLYKAALAHYEKELEEL